MAYPLGADTVMDPSTGRYIHETRERVLRNSPVPIGTGTYLLSIGESQQRSRNHNLGCVPRYTAGHTWQVVDYFNIQAVVLLRLH
jgi:phosphomethylpyrimidine synthase